MRGESHVPGSDGTLLSEKWMGGGAWWRRRGGGGQAGQSTQVGGGAGKRSRGSPREVVGFQATLGAVAVVPVPCAASSFCAGSARHHSHKLCQDKAKVPGLLPG